MKYCIVGRNIQDTKILVNPDGIHQNKDKHLYNYDVVYVTKTYIDKEIYSCNFGINTISSARKICKQLKLEKRDSNSPPKHHTYKIIKVTSKVDIIRWFNA